MKKRTFLFVVLLSPFSFHLSPLSAQTITNEAGNNTLGYGYSGNGGLATNAQLHTPNGVGVDTSGNLYITDLANSVIRKVNHSTGIITTVAGNGIAGFSGDGGQATAAELNQPTGTAFDTLGNLYIADKMNNRIREVNISTGVINTIAGNGISGYNGDGAQATSAELGAPQNIAFDRHSNIYIADDANNVVREVIYSSGIISTVAGDYALGAGFSGDTGPATFAQLNQPTGVSLDTNGNIFIADYLNVRIREVIASTGIISTVAGNGISGYSGDGGPATSAELRNAPEIWMKKTGVLDIADAGNNAIRAVPISTGIISTVAGGNGTGYTGDGGPATSSQLWDASCVAFNKAKDMFIADDGNQVIRMVNTTGIITTFAGNKTLGFGYSGDRGVDTLAQLHAPNSVVVDAYGDRYIADYSNQVIRKLSHDSIYTIAGNYLDSAGYSGDGGPATSAELNNPADIAFDASHNMYIADYGNNVIRKVSGGFISTVAGNYFLGAGYSGDGGQATSAQLNNPAGVAVDSIGNIYIADYGNNLIREVTVSNGNINTYAGNFGLGGGFSGDGGPATSAQLGNPVRVRVGHGLVIVSEAGPAFVPSAFGHNISTCAGCDNQDIRGIEAGEISTKAGNHSLGAGFSGDGGPATLAQLHDPAGIDIDANNNIYIADYTNNLVREVQADTGTINTIAGNFSFGPGFSGNGGPATAAELNNPAGIAITDTALYIADKMNHIVRKVTVTPTGINKLSVGSNQLSVYPNPTNERLFINVGQMVKPNSFQILDITGRVLLTDHLQQTTDHFSIDVSSLTPGMYILKVMDSNSKQILGKFVVE